MAMMPAKKIRLVSGGAEPEAAVGGGLGQVVADRGAERAGEHVDDPERQHGVQTEPPADRGGGDRPPRRRSRSRGSPARAPRAMRSPAAVPSAKVTRIGEPVERLTAAGEDRVDRQGALDAVPGDERRPRAARRTPPCSARAGPEVVGELVGDQRAEHAHQRHRRPVPAGVYRSAANCAASTITRSTPVAIDVPVRPRLTLTLRKSAADSPTVVQSTLMIQK